MQLIFTFLLFSHFCFAGTFNAKEMIKTEFLKAVEKSPISDKKKKKYKKIIKEARVHKKVPTFFYLYSLSLPHSNLKIFLDLGKKLQTKVNSSIEIYGVFRGMAKEKKFKKFLRRFRPNDESSMIRFDASIFKKLNIKQVPAYVFSYCNTQEYFDFRKCDNKFIVRGDITLRKFISLMAKKDAKFDKYYEALNF